MKITIELVSDDGTRYSGEAVLHPSGSKPGAAKAKIQSSAPVKAKSCAGVLRMMWEQGAFKVALSLTEIKSAVEKMEYSFPDPTLSMALLRSSFLTRHGARGSFNWKQKYPAS